MDGYLAWPLYFSSATSRGSWNGGNAQIQVEYSSFPADVGTGILCLNGGIKWVVGECPRGLRGRFIFAPPLNSTPRTFIYLGHLNRVSMRF